MTEDRLDRIQRIYCAALEHDPASRPTFLETECGGDAELRAEVESLLAVGPSADGFLDSPPRPEGLELGVEERAGDSDLSRTIGPYRLLRKIASGGMGTVWLGERADAQYEKSVAVKLIKPGLDREDILRRFMSERQFLANLEHPNIARLLDGGATEEGLPFLVMEYIDGVPIDRYCRNHRLTLRARLELFKQVCEAAHYAHQNLVLHRDLKPSNILVTTDGIGKLLDFGIARLLPPSGELDPQDVTETGARLLTPRYASPEQIRGEALSVASDVYSLGVILYELLTGRTPYRTTTGSRREFEEAVCEQDPRRPSTAVLLDGSEGHRESRRGPESDRVDPAERQRLSRRLRGDLDAIVLRALRKERERRYGSVLELAEDLERHLAGLPVKARPDTLLYRATKLVRRNRVAVASGVMVLVVLVGATIVSARFALEESRQRRAAEESRDDEKAVIDFLTDDLLGQASPFEQPDPDIKVRTAVERAAKEAGVRFADKPRIEATVRTTLGRTYEGLGLYEKAHNQYEMALAIRRRVLGDEAAETLEIRNRLAGLQYSLGDYERMKELAAENLERNRGILGPYHAHTLEALHDLAVASELTGDFERSVELYREALATQREVLGPEHDQTLLTLLDLGLFYLARGEYADAEATLGEHMEVVLRRKGEDHPDAILSLASFAEVLIETERFEEAEDLLRHTLRVSERVLGPTHNYYLATKSLLAKTTARKGDLDTAEVLFREVIDETTRTLGRDHEQTRVALSHLATLYQNTKRFSKAETVFREIADITERTLGDDNPGHLISLNNLARLYLEMERPQAALPIFEEVTTVARRDIPEDWLTGVFLTNHGTCLTQLERFDESEKVLLDARAILGQALGERHARTLKVVERMVELYEAWGKGDAVRQWKAWLAEPNPTGGEGPESS